MLGPTEREGDQTDLRREEGRRWIGLREREVGQIKPKAKERILITFPIKLITKMIIELLKTLSRLKLFQEKS